MYISTNELLADVCNDLNQESSIFVDTEFIREKTYYPKLCLLQIASSKEDYLIDVLSITDTSPLQKLFTNPTVLKVFHSCSQDIEVLYFYLGVIAKPIFDTQVAASFLGKKMQIGYAPLVKSVCDIELPKSQSLSDWCKRPLDESQIQYALNDIKYLPAIYKWEEKKLKELGRYEWVFPELDVFLKKETYEMDPYLAYRKVRRHGQLSRRKLAICREIAAWREKHAQKKNIPRRWVLPDEIVIEISRVVPDTKNKLLKIRSINDYLNTSLVDEVLRAVERGKDLAKEDWPPKEEKVIKTKESESVSDLMYALVRVISEETGIAAAMLAKKKELSLLEFEKDESRLMKTWRKKVVGEKLMSLLHGKLALTVEGDRVKVAHIN